MLNAWPLANKNLAEAGFSTHLIENSEVHDASQHQHEHKGQRHAEKPKNDRHWVCSVDHLRLPINESIAVTFRSVGSRKAISSAPEVNVSLEVLNV